MKNCVSFCASRREKSGGKHRDELVHVHASMNKYALLYTSQRQLRQRKTKRKAEESRRGRGGRKEECSVVQFSVAQVSRLRKADPRQSTRFSCYPTRVMGTYVRVQRTRKYQKEKRFQSKRLFSRGFPRRTENRRRRTDRPRTSNRVTDRMEYARTNLSICTLDRR